MKNFNWPDRLFVSGIDTDAGKSYATGWLAAELRKNGIDTITMKFVQTGNENYSEDIEVHRKLMGIKQVDLDLDHTTAPEIFTYPCSPDLAARIDKREIDFDKIDNSIKRLTSKYDCTLVEGAGGLMVPLKGEYLTIDYIRDRKLPLVLVTNGSLGSISHTLLALKAVEDYGIRLLAVIYNTYFDYDKIIADDTRNYIKNWLGSHFKETLFIEMNNQ